MAGLARGARGDVMPEMYVCDKHGSSHQQGDGCPDCAGAFANRRSPDSMTPVEREAELRWWGTFLTIPFADLHQRYEELVGRAIWTHEFADPEALILEARARAHPTPQEILDKLPSHHVRVIVIDGAEAQP